MNYVLLDFENVQPLEVDSLAVDQYRLMVFVGASQSKLSYDIATSIQRLGSSATYVKISGNGSNALDFHIAYYIGHLAASEPTAHFFIVSKDTGFDPLVKHLQTKKIRAARVKSIADLPTSKPRSLNVPTPKPTPLNVVASNFDTLLLRLQNPKSPKPRTLTTLGNTISALFNKKLSPEEIQLLRKRLISEGHISVVGTKVTYRVASEV